MTQIQQHPEYYITTSGDVYSDINNAGNRRSVLHKLTQTIGRDGYYWVGLKGSNKKMKKIHRLVAETFIPNPDNLPVVNHIDGNKLNNNVDNLEWCTYAHNTRHAVLNGLLHHNTGEDHHSSKLSNEEVRNVIQLTLDGYTNEEIAEQFCIHSRYVSLIRHKKRQISIWEQYFKDVEPMISDKAAKFRDADTTMNIVIASLSTTRSNADIAKEFSIDASTVSKIRNGKPSKYFLSFILKYNESLTTIENTSSDGSE